MMQSEIKGQMVIATPRFSLRPARNSDAGMIDFYSQDKRLAQMTTHIPHPLPPGAAEAFLTRVTKPESDEQVWSIDGSADGMGEVLGMVSLKSVTDNQSEISFWVAPNLWNSGLASEAVTSMIKANPQGVTSLVASVFQDNPASAKILTNEGFALIGESEVFSVARNGMVNTWDYLLHINE